MSTSVAPKCAAARTREAAAPPHKLVSIHPEPLMQHGRRMAAAPLLKERLPPQRRSCEQMVHCTLDECSVAVRAHARMRVAVRRERLPNGRMLVLPELQRRFNRLLARQLRLRPEQQQ